MDSANQHSQCVKSDEVGDWFDLRGQVAIVTGAAHGIGRAIAEGLAGVGVNVVLVDILVEELQQVAAAIANAGQDALAIPADLGNENDLSMLVDRTISKFGRIDILVNCAGVSRGGACEEYSQEDWDFTFNVNVRAAFRLGKLVARHMIERKRGSIINVTSIGASLGFPNNPAYQASKGAQQQLTRAMACDWAKYNIRVNNLCPGHILADMTKKSWSDPDTYKQRAALCMMGRWGKPGELVGPVIFLASRASSYMTGNDLYIDGGYAKTGLTEAVAALSQSGRTKACAE